MFKYLPVGIIFQRGACNADSETTKIFSDIRFFVDALRNIKDFSEVDVVDLTEDNHFHRLKLINETVAQVEEMKKNIHHTTKDGFEITMSFDKKPKDVQIELSFGNENAVIDYDENCRPAVEYLINCYYDTKE